MTSPDTPAHHSLWTGRRGLVNTLAILALALPCALAVRGVAERTTAIPACEAYGAARGLDFVSVQHFSQSDDARTVCTYRQSDGITTDVSTAGMLPFATNLALGFALDVKIMYGMSVALLSLLRIGVFVSAGGLHRVPAKAP